MSNLDQILEDFKCQSKGDVVQMLVGLGSVDKLRSVPEGRRFPSRRILFTPKAERWEYV